MTTVSRATARAGPVEPAGLLGQPTGAAPENHRPGRALRDRRRAGRLARARPPVAGPGADAADGGETARRPAGLDGERFAATKETWFDVQVQQKDTPLSSRRDRDLADDRQPAGVGVERFADHIVDDAEA